MDIQSELDGLKPRRKQIVFDVVESLGFDTSDWIASATNPRKIKANPKYCYDWSFVQPEKVAIFNLWHDAMKIEDGAIVYRDNGGKTQWITRGLKLDRDAARAATENLEIRVLVVHGKRRATQDPHSDSSKVSHRELDAEPWHIRHYDSQTGEFVLARGSGQSAYVDQFDGEPLVAEVERRQVSGTVYTRNRDVRQAALIRSKGRCEYCDEPGFRTLSGRIYLETHHVIPLSEGGPDAVDNVIAVCPLDHRKAHYAYDALAIRGQMIETLKRKLR
jgi:5-methylcytosine-specific restriction protein A